ncbi:histidine phosphatase family protein [Actinokineospora diospyrosa]|uniref:Phosphomutase, MSMEG_4193 family n=1 Tax=Actinokineospora diospyrosa TaxID=103728 RepID=A0ABT1IE46_9PSEU|nr:histidine phosphatase family protein [Actinokineospora diospyrosa]MCP2270900.1 putative phosphomutase, MSMEG_4193 family [Actinokineospora diospyrosa]
MATLVLLRHARSTANGSGVLAGRSEGVTLDPTGQRQAADLVDRLAEVTLHDIVRSPLPRCEQTISALAAARGLEPVVDDAFLEVDYGSWTGKAIKDLLGEPLWKVVQQHPSAAVFPDGEGLADVQARAVRAVRAHDARITAKYGERAVWLLCSHGDVIKSILSDALGQHLDTFQRIVVDPASVSVIRYTETRPFVLRMNDAGKEFAGVVPPEPKPEENTGDATVGGSTGSA